MNVSFFGQTIAALPPSPTHICSCEIAGGGFAAIYIWGKAPDRPICGRHSRAQIRAELYPPTPAAVCRPRSSRTSSSISWPRALADRPSRSARPRRSTTCRLSADDLPRCATPRERPRRPRIAMLRLSDLRTPSWEACWSRSKLVKTPAHGLSALILDARLECGDYGSNQGGRGMTRSRRRRQGVRTVRVRRRRGATPGLYRALGWRTCAAIFWPVSGMQPISTWTGRPGAEVWHDPDSATASERQASALIAETSHRARDLRGMLATLWPI